jgi:hypothetical protein
MPHWLLDAQAISTIVATIVHTIAEAIQAYKAR